MGNENWGQAFTDWPPDVYARTVEVYARALRAELAAAQKQHPEIAGLKLYIVAVGFPVMGNNMLPVDTPDRRTNIAWTGALNRLATEGIIDAVQEHFYPYASGNGGALVWAAHNLQNILDARLGRANPRLGGYLDPPLVYRMPLEFTEWNIKCWGPQFRELKELRNGSFEAGLEGWAVRGGSAAVSLRAARRGSRGVRVDLGRGDAAVEIIQEFDIPDGILTLLAAVWARASRAGAVRVELRTPAGEAFGGFASCTENHWERVLASGRPIRDSLDRRRRRPKTVGTIESSRNTRETAPSTAASRAPTCCNARADRTTAAACCRSLGGEFRLRASHHPQTEIGGAAEGAREILNARSKSLP